MNASYLALGTALLLAACDQVPEPQAGFAGLGRRPPPTPRSSGDGR
ncbi:hypothetical protein ACE0DR_05115 [Azotobacter sp. CWF10]